MSSIPRVQQIDIHTLEICTYNSGGTVFIPRLGTSPEERNSNPFCYSCLGNPKVRGTLWAAVHGVIKESDTTEQLNNYIYCTHMQCTHMHTHTYAHKWSLSTIIHVSNVDVYTCTHMLIYIHTWDTDRYTLEIYIYI